MDDAAECFVSITERRFDRHRGGPPLRNLPWVFFPLNFLPSISPFPKLQQTLHVWPGRVHREIPKQMVWKW